MEKFTNFFLKIINNLDLSAALLANGAGSRFVSRLSVRAGVRESVALVGRQQNGVVVPPRECDPTRNVRPRRYRRVARDM